MLGTISIQVDNVEAGFEPGSLMTAQLQWQLDAPPDAVRIALVWFTLGKGSRDCRVVQRLSIDGPLEASGVRRLGIQLPVSPWSFSGSLITLTWALEVIAYPSKDRARCEFIMAPGGKEIVLR